MGTLGWFGLWFIGLGALAYHRIALLPSSLFILLGLVFSTLFSSIAWYLLVPAWLVATAGIALMNHPDLREKYVTGRLFQIFKVSLPSMSATEKQALNAGTVSWDGELFSGKPNWNKLLHYPAPPFTAEEQAFLDGPVREVSEMTVDWEACEQYYDLPPHVWAFLSKNGFFALIIPKHYGGKEFSASLHSEVISRLAGRSSLLATIVSVPNSLGPAELLLHYGTEEQKDYYLPRLAKGEEIPCFALTAPEAGSDAGSITDTGVVCKGFFEGKEVIGLKLNWDKRYITLAPIATLLGLAFKLYDPNRLLGEDEDRGITCALIPVQTAGISIGKRHWPSNLPFQNGPTQGKDVFIPIDWIIGGPSMAGQGWRMLVECLSVGRAISLPATSCGGGKTGAFVTGAYALIRRQFNTSISNFEGIQEAMTRLAGFTYISEATRIFTARFVDQGEKPSVPGAIAKYHVTEFGRKIAIEAFDIHGGKAIMQGPNNYLARGYQSAPIAITVEGANILTRSLIIFGQGAIRCHPYIFKEMEAVQQDNFRDFDQLLCGHIGYLLSNVARSSFHALTFGRLGSSPSRALDAPYFKQLNRAAAAFALIADSSMILLGGKLKFKESLSGRLSDCLSMLYLSSATLKHYADQGRPEEDFPLVSWSLTYLLHQFWTAMQGILDNLPNRAAATALKAIIMPFGFPVKMPSDKLNKQITQLLTSDSATRNRLTQNVFVSIDEEDPIAVVNQAFLQTLATMPIRQRLMEAIKSKTLASAPLESAIDAALKAKIVTKEEAESLLLSELLCRKVIAVDDFEPSYFKHRAEKLTENRTVKAALIKEQH